MRWVSRLLSLPRITRIAIALFFALMLTLALSPWIDWLYIRYFFTAESVIAPSLISTGAGCGMYIAGWILLVGTPGQELPARRALLWYVVLGMAAAVVVGILLLQGISSNSAG